ncbi:MAG TPA: hydrogenase [Bdellovibrionota bacterium]|nr:hydrogenase [Bdellovibrionota bacterium]
MTSRHHDWLCFSGVFLFLLGLLTGFANPIFLNPRLGLSGHLEGVMNGMFLVLVGLIWQRVSLSSGARTWAFWLLLWGSYANWFACILGAVTGASRMTPIAGAGHSAEPWQEMIVSGLFGSVGVAMLAALALLAWGLRPGKLSPKPARRSP